MQRSRRWKAGLGARPWAATVVCLLVLLVGLSACGSRRDQFSYSAGSSLDPTGVSCLTPTACSVVLTDGAGGIETFYGSGRQWVGPDLIGGDVGSTSRNFPAAAIACPRSGDCTLAVAVTVGKEGAVQLYTLGRSQRWAAGPKLVDPTSQGSDTIYLSCPTDSFCMLSDGQDAWNGRNGDWTRAAPPNGPDDDTGFGAVSCLSATSCLAVSSAMYTWNGSSWTRQRQAPPITADQLSCARPSSCIATGYNLGVPIDKSLPPEGWAAAWNGTTWSAPRHFLTERGGSHLGFVATSCVAMSSCYAVDDRGYLYGYGSGGWHGPAKVGRKGSIVTGMACPSVSRCIVLDETGARFITATPPAVIGGF